MNEPVGDFRKNVFVVGAGADKVYGYPDGGELTTRICEELANDQSQVYMDLEELVPREGVLRHFRDKFWYSETYSIDAFLKRNPDFERIGKLAIARILMECENEAHLFSKQRKVNAEHWYRKVFYTIDNHLKGDWTSLRHGHFSFVTFNYSRTLKHYLYCKLKNLHNMDDQQIREVIKKLNIVQVHGSLGLLPFEEQFARPYSHQNIKTHIEAAAGTIRIAYETNGKEPTSTVHQKIKSIMDLANRIFFLGFSFHPDNLELLHLPLDREPKPRFHSSSIGISQSELGRIKKAIGHVKGFEKELGIMEILENYEFI